MDFSRQKVHPQAVGVDALTCWSIFQRQPKGGFFPNTQRLKIDGITYGRGMKKKVLSWVADSHRFPNCSPGKIPMMRQFGGMVWSL